MMKTDKLTNACCRAVVIVIGITLGLCYVLQEDIVIAPQHPILGYSLIAACVALVGFEARHLVRRMRG